MIPSSRHWYRYPAFEYLLELEPSRYSVALPVGLAGLFRQGADPTLYNRNKARFLAEFDLLSSLVQLKYPYWYLLDLPRSPEKISVWIEKGTVTVDDGGGAALSFASVSGSGGISRQASLLLPPPIVGFPFRKGAFSFRTDLFGGMEGYSLGPDEALESAVANREIVPQVRYGLNASLSASAGISEGITWVFHRTLWDGNVGLVLAPRLYMYSILAYLKATSDAYFFTDNNGLPGIWGYTWKAEYLYPGKGFGFGARLDLGAMLIFKSLILTGTLLDIAGWKYITGRTTGADQPESVSSRFVENTFDYIPSPLLLVRWRLPTKIIETVLSFEARFIESFGASAAIRLFADPIYMETTVRYHDTLQLEIRSGARIGRIRIEGSLLFFEEPISKRNLIGCGVSVEVLGAK